MAPSWRTVAASAVAIAGLFLLLTAETDLTYYDRVGVPENADLAVIKKAYRVKAMQLHPDKNLGEKHWLRQWWQGDDEHRFSRLVEAHDCLVDQECRAKYDEEMRGLATAQELGWQDRWALRRRAKEAQWKAAWSSVNSPRELVQLMLHTAQDFVLSVPDWLPGMLTPRGLIRGTFFVLIFLLSVETVLKPAVALLWLPAKAAKWLLMELSGQRKRNDLKKQEAMAEARQRQQTQALLPPEPEPEPWTVFAERVSQEPVTPAQKMAIAQAVGKFVGGSELLLKILEAILTQPGDAKFRKVKTSNKAFAGLLALGGARDLVFKIGFEPTDDFMHLVLPETRVAFAAHAKKALLVAAEQNNR